MTGRADTGIRRTTIGCVGLLALIAATVSYLHMHALVALHGQPAWVAPLTSLSVDGMIVAASTTLLAESRAGSRGAVLPWSLLAAGGNASLAANVTVAEPTATGRVIAARPSFALIGSYESAAQLRRRTGRKLRRAGRGRRAQARPGPRGTSGRPVGISGGRRGGGPKPIAARTDRCQVARRSARSSPVTSGGAG